MVQISSYRSEYLFPLIPTDVPQETYAEALKLGEAEVAYGRLMMIGHGGSGKSSLYCSLMDILLPKLAESTRLAESYKVKLQYASAECDRRWRERTDEDDISELVDLLEKLILLRSTGNPSDQVSMLKSVHDAPANQRFNPLDKDASELSTDNRSDLGRHAGVQEVLKELVQKRQKSMGQQSQKQAYVRIWDCGGQLTFLNILPAFLTQRTLFMLTFDASVNLNDKAPIVTRRKGKVVHHESHYLSTKEIMMQWMASIHSHLCPPTNQQPKLPRVMLVGTHRDKLSTPQTSSEEEIREELHSTYKDKRYAHLLLPSPVYFIDNTKAGKGEDQVSGVKDIRQAVSKFVLEDLSVRTPITWVFFRRVMERMFKNTPLVELKEVTAIAIACDIPSEAVFSVLHFYHQLGVFLHFVDIPRLRDFVIIDPQWLIKNFAKLFDPIFEDQGMTNLWKKFRSEGVLVEELYRNVLAGVEVDPQALVDILEHFLLASFIEPREKSKEDGKWYFLPSMLPGPTEGGDTSQTQPIVCQAEVLHLVFEYQYVPPGFFVRLVACLAHEENGTDLCKSRNDSMSVRFHYGELEDEVLVKETIDTIEVHVSRFVDIQDSRSFRDTCRVVLQLLQASVESVKKWLPFKLQFAFKCPCNKGYQVITPETLVLYCDKCLWRYSPSREQQYWLHQRVKSTKDGDARDTSSEGAYTLTGSSTSHSPRLDETPTISELNFLENSEETADVKIIATIQGRWTELPGFFQLPPHTVTNLKAPPNFEPRGACEEVFRMWLKGGSVRYRQPKSWATVLKCVGRYLDDHTLADTIRTVLST